MANNKEEAGYGDPLGGDPLGDYFAKDFNIIKFMSDSDDLIESLADRSSDSKSTTSSSANTNHNNSSNNNNNRPQTNNTYNEQYSNNTQSIESETWISPVPSDDYQIIPQNSEININTSNFISNSSSAASNPRNNNNIYIIDPTPPTPTTPFIHSQPSGSSSSIIIPPHPLTHNPNYPLIMAYSQQHQPQSSSSSSMIATTTPMQYSPFINTTCNNNNPSLQPQLFISPQQSFINNSIGSNSSSNNGGNIGNIKRQNVSMNIPITNNTGPPAAKRKATTSSSSDLLIAAQKPIIKSEPIFEEDDDENNIYGSNNLLSSTSMSRMESNENLQQRQIQFLPFNMDQWSTLYNINQQPFNNLRLNTVADKGFNYSYIEGAFINQKKNHFQITVNVDLGSSITKPAYFCVNGILKEIADFKLALCGIKAEMPTTEINLRQSNSNRKPIQYEPASVQIGEKQTTQIKIPRLHFSEPTANNNRKNGKPNPDQRFFFLLVQLQVYAHDGSFCIVQAYQSEKVIVRAGNPAQFGQNPPPEPEAIWQSNKNILFTHAPVAIGTNAPINNAQLTVYGNIVSTGVHTHPSDERVKENIVKIDTRDALDRVTQIQIVDYSYKPEFAEQWGLDETNRHRTGVIAQQLAQILPDAVRDNGGGLLTVDDTRVFYDTVAAAQELYRVTGSLENKIGQVEKISAKLAKFAKNKNKFGGSSISGLSGLTYLEEKKYDEDGKSIYSLTSNYSNSMSHHDSPQHRRRRRRYSNEDMCSSKFTQYTVTFLIGIMALCLLATCSLYVLDWYRRISNDPHGNLIPAFNYSDDVIGNLIEQKYGLPLSWLPEFQPFAPMLASKCGLKRHCPIYCCESGGPPPLEKKHNLNESLTFPDNGLPTTTNIDNKEFYDLSTPMPFENNFSLEIINLNVSIDKRYCIENSCRSRRGRFNLYVPMSSYLPTIPLQIRFNVKENKFVDNCGSLRDFFHKKCNTNFAGIEEIEHPTSYTINENTFELSVGDFIHSAYRFRIGYTTESCNMSEDQRGRSFDEFNIVFYRKCFIVSSSSQNNNNNSESNLNLN